MRCSSTFSGCGWAYGFTLTPLAPQTFPQIWRGWLKSYLMQVCKPCPYALIEAVEPFKLHPMSMPYRNMMFEHLLRLWMGIWLHIHIIMTTDTSPDLWELAEILPDATNHAITLLLRLYNLSNCIPCPCHTYMRCLSTFSGCGWAYGYTLTSIPP